MIDLDGMLGTMKMAAQRAGAGLRDDFSRVEKLTITPKAGIGDLQSSADLRAEQTIKETLRAQFPDYGMLCEEGGREEGKNPDCRWIVDPLDGTMNFLRRIPLFAVNIAAEVREELVAAVTYLPASNDLFWAVKDRGAYRNGERIYASARNGLRAATVSVGMPFAEKAFHAEFHREMAALTPRVAQVRRLGSCALELAYVACGNLDAYWERDVSAWDIAAGMLLVQEAGGHVSDVNGRPALLAARSILGAAPGVAAELLALLRFASRDGAL